MKTEVPALDRGLDILELILSKKSLGFGEIVETLSLPTASAARILKRLCQRGYLVKDVDSGVYMSGSFMQGLMVEKSVSERLLEVSAVALGGMRDSTSQTAILFYWNGQAWECIGKELHESSVTMQEIGEVRVDIFSYPWSCFAYEQLNKENRRITYGPDSKDIDQMEQRLSEYEKGGYVICSSNHFHRMTVPLRDSNGDLIGALALGMTPAVMDDLGEEYSSKILIDGREKIEQFF